MLPSHAPSIRDMGDQGLLPVACDSYVHWLSNFPCFRLRRGNHSAGIFCFLTIISSTPGSFERPTTIRQQIVDWQIPTIS